MVDFGEQLASKNKTVVFFNKKHHCRIDKARAKTKIKGVFESALENKICLIYRDNQFFKPTVN